MQEYIKEELGLVSEINPDPTFFIKCLRVVRNRKTI